VSVIAAATNTVIVNELLPRNGFAERE
jgi:hypothetical protein